MTLTFPVFQVEFKVKQIVHYWKPLYNKNKLYKRPIIFFSMKPCFLICSLHGIYRIFLESCYSKKKIQKVTLNGSSPSHLGPFKENKQEAIKCYDSFQLKPSLWATEKRTCIKRIRNEKLLDINLQDDVVILPYTLPYTMQHVIVQILTSSSGKIIISLWVEHGKIFIAVCLCLLLILSRGIKKKTFEILYKELAKWHNALANISVWVF